MFFDHCAYGVDHLGRVHIRPVAVDISHYIPVSRHSALERMVDRCHLYLGVEFLEPPAHDCGCVPGRILHKHQDVFKLAMNLS